MDLTFEELVAKYARTAWVITHEPEAERYHAYMEHWGSLYGQTPNELDERLDEWRQYRDTYPDVSGAGPPTAA